MARVRQRRVFWEASPDADVQGYYFYVGDPQDANFLQSVDAGSVAPYGSLIEGTQVVFGQGDLPEGNYQFAVCAFDGANYSDPYQHPAWSNVPLDLTPPAPPFGGGLAMV